MDRDRQRRGGREKRTYKYIYNICISILKVCLQWIGMYIYTIEKEIEKKEKEREQERKRERM